MSPAARSMLPRRIISVGFGCWHVRMWRRRWSGRRRFRFPRVKWSSDGLRIVTSWVRALRRSWGWGRGSWGGSWRRIGRRRGCDFGGNLVRGFFCLFALANFGGRSWVGTLKGDAFANDKLWLKLHHISNLVISVLCNMRETLR